MITTTFLANAGHLCTSHLKRCGLSLPRSAFGSLLWPTSIGIRRRNMTISDTPNVTIGANGMSANGTTESAQAAVSCLDTQDFASLRKEMEHYDAQREIVIKRSRDVQKLAKQAIFSAHRDDEKQCHKRLKEAEQIARELLPMIDELPGLRHGSFSISMEEYAEAKALQVFLKERRVIRSSELDMVDRDEYLGGVLDFTGELNRYAIAKATVRDVREVQLCRDIVEGLMGEFLQFDLRNGAVRKKYDSLKYTLKKLENTLYELSLAEAGFKPQVEDVEPQQVGASEPAE